MIGEVVVEKWIADMNSSWFFKDEENGTYKACDDSVVGAIFITSDALPKNSLRQSAPISYEDLKDRFQTPIRFFDQEDEKKMKKFKSKCDKGAWKA